jgi:hypothetical protein
VRFYAAKWREDEPTAGNCEWFTSKREAEREARNNDGIVRTVDVEPTKAGILALLKDKAWRL